MIKLDLRWEPVALVPYISFLAKFFVIKVNVSLKRFQKKIFKDIFRTKSKTYDGAPLQVQKKCSQTQLVTEESFGFVLCTQLAKPPEYG